MGSPEINHTKPLRPEKSTGISMIIGMGTRRLLTAGLRQYRTRQGDTGLGHGDDERVRAWTLTSIGYQWRRRGARRLFEQAPVDSTGLLPQFQHLSTSAPQVMPRSSCMSSVIIGAFGLVPAEDQFMPLASRWSLGAAFRIRIRQLQHCIASPSD